MQDKKSNFIRLLFENNSRDLLNFFTRRVGREEAPDLLQEAFVRALRHENLDSIINPPAFLQRIASNLTRDHVRRKKTEAKYLRFTGMLGDPPAEDAPADVRVDYDRRLQRLRAAIERLPPRCREVFELSAFEDAPFPEIARRLGISERMVREHMSIAMRRCWAAIS